MNYIILIFVDIVKRIQHQKKKLKITGAKVQTPCLYFFINNCIDENKTL